MRNEQDSLLNNAPESVEHYLNRIAKKIYGDIFSEDVIVPGLLNFVRDWVWTFFSYDLLDARLNQSSDANFDAKSQWLGQQIYSTLAMLFALGGMAAFYKIKKPSDKNGHEKKFPWADGFIYLIAASIAIYGWDRMQVIGIDIAQQKLNYSNEKAGYFAAILTGLEGLMQYLAIVTLRTLAIGSYYTAAKNDFKKFLKQFLAGMGCSATFVLLPGAFWELTYTLGVTKKWGAIPTSFLVAFTVAFFNYVSVKISVLFLTTMFHLCNKARVVAQDEIVSVGSSNSSVASDLDNTTRRVDGEIQTALLINTIEAEKGNRVETQPPPSLNPVEEPVITTAKPPGKKGWALVKSNLGKKAFTQTTDHMPTKTDENVEESPLQKVTSNLGSSLRKFGSLRSFKTNTDTHEKPSETGDPAFGPML